MIKHEPSSKLAHGAYLIWCHSKSLVVLIARELLDSSDEAYSRIEGELKAALRAEEHARKNFEDVLKAEAPALAEA